MNCFVLDTCALIWIALGDNKISESTLKLVQSKDASIYLPVISIAELACLADHKKIMLEQHWKKWLDKFIYLTNIKVAAIDYEIICDAYALPGQFHNDPADRLIVATARKLSAYVVTKDQKILDYPFVKSLS